MKVNEDLSILFWLKRQKATKEDLAPIYVRITVKAVGLSFLPVKKFIPIIGTKNLLLPRATVLITN